ncbi:MULTISPECIES: hypothetical protein [Sorangium]|uniref:hypothetical protein n=1 Tax=Sorangium TaxID=39643 RepID=UPI003D9C26A2
MPPSDPTPAHPFPCQQNHEPAPHPAAALFGADPRLVEGVDAAAAAIAIEVAATQLGAAVAGGLGTEEDAAPRIVRVRDAAIVLARAATLGARALVDTRPPTSPTAPGLDAAAARLAEVIVGFDAAGGSAYLAPSDPEEPIEAFGRRRHREAREALLALVRAAAAPAAAGSSAPRVAAGSPEERYRRALDAEAYAERAYRAAREATDTARDALLSTRARAITADQGDEDRRMRELFRERAEQLGLDGAEVSR